MNEPSIDSESNQSNGIWSRLRYPAALLSVIAIHAGLLLYFEPLEAIFSIHPLGIGDYHGHFLQAYHFIEAMEGWGKTWAYDFRFLAGFPVNTVFDSDNKAWELWTYGLWKLGVSKGAAFNSFLFLAHVLVLPTVYLSARLFGLGRWGVLVATALGSSLWYFDSTAHFCWYAGMGAYCFSAYLFLLPTALFYRYLQDGRFWQAALAALLGGIVHLIHPYAFFAMVLPMGVPYLQAFKSLRGSQHAIVVGVAVVIIGINAYWMLVAVDFLRYSVTGGIFGQASLVFLPADFFGLVLDTAATGVVGSRTGFRFLCFGAALVTIVLWRHSGDRRFWPFAASIGALVLLAYVGGYLEATSKVQPYRHVFPAFYLAVIPAGALVDILINRRTFYGLPKLVYAVIFLLMLPGVQHLSRDVLYFFRDLMPTIAEAPTRISATGYPNHLTYRHRPWHPNDDLLAQWVDANNDGKGRFLVEFESLGDQLPWKTGAEILGGFLYRNLKHATANLYHPLNLNGQIKTESDLREYLESYAIQWILAPSDHRWYDTMPGLFRLVAESFGCRTYRTNIEPSFFQEGAGKLRADLNELVVSGTDPEQDIVLRYQWVHTLVCEPECSVQRTPNRFSRVGFIKVPAPHPSRFVIRNGY